LQILHNTVFKHYKADIHTTTSISIQLRRLMGFINRHLDLAFITFIMRILVRTSQFLFALAVAGLYGIHLDSLRRSHLPIATQWVYAEVVAGLSAVTVLLYSVPGIKAYRFVVCDMLML